MIADVPTRHDLIREFDPVIAAHYGPRMLCQRLRLLLPLLQS